MSYARSAKVENDDQNEVFCTSFTYRDHSRRANHGCIWTHEHLSRLEELFHQGASLQEMCEDLQRPADGTLNKLLQKKLVRRDLISNVYYRVRRRPQALPPQAPEDITMTQAAPVIETKTFIEGIDAANLSDEQIFKKIASLEISIKTWGAIENKPKKLDAMIEQTKADITALVSYVDGR